MIACLTWALDTLIRYPLLGLGFSTLQIVLMEHLTLVIVTLPLLWRYRQQFFNLNMRSFGALFFIGGIGSAVGTLAYTQAFAYLNPTVVILLQKLQPVVAIVLASWFLNERIRGYFIRWAGLILLGSVVMIRPDIHAMFSQSVVISHASMASWYGYGLTLLAVIAWGAATVCGKYLSEQKMNANAIMSGRFLMGLVVLVPLALLNTPKIHAMSAQPLLMLIVMALLSGLAGMWFYYQGLNRIPAQVTTLAEQTFPIFAALINWLFLSMSLSMYQLLGAVLLIVGNVGLRFKELHLAEQSSSHLKRA